MNQQNVLQKKIQIVNLGQKQVNWNDPQKGMTTFTVYQIFGNDGLTYETPDQNLFTQRKIGETFDAKYMIKTRDYNGKIYTSYRLVSPPKTSNSDQVMEALRKTYFKITEMEQNILAAIRLSGGLNIPGPEDVEIPSETETPDIEIEEVNKNLTDIKLENDNPF